MSEGHTLAEREGWLYVKLEFTQYTEPVKNTFWYPIGVRFAEWKHRFNSEEEARAYLDSSRLHHSVDGLYSDENGQWYCLTERGQTTPEHVDQCAVPEPKQRGHKLPMRWQDGGWKKETRKGWVWA